MEAAYFSNKSSSLDNRSLFSDRALVLYMDNLKALICIDYRAYILVVGCAE